MSKVSHKKAKASDQAIRQSSKVRTGINKAQAAEVGRTYSAGARMNWTGWLRHTPRFAERGVPIVGLEPSCLPDAP